MQIVAQPDGSLRCLYGEEIDLAAFGQPVIARASHVEPTSDGRWTADLSPAGGPTLGPFHYRSAALEAERRWLNGHWL